MKLSQFRYYKAFNVIKPQRLQLVVPSFAFAAQTWAGVSNLVGSMELANDYYFSLKYPVKQFGQAFVLAVSWSEDSVSNRFKLWEDVDEVLYYPLYNGEKIGINAVLEIWTINSDAAVVNPDNHVIRSSILAFPQNSCCTCCSQPNAEQLLSVSAAEPCSPYSYCQPFCPE